MAEADVPTSASSLAALDESENTRHSPYVARVLPTTASDIPMPLAHSVHRVSTGDDQATLTPGPVRFFTQDHGASISATLSTSVEVPVNRLRSNEALAFSLPGDRTKSGGSHAVPAHIVPPVVSPR